MSLQLEYGDERNRPNGLYYKHSGRTPIYSVFLAGTLGVIAAICIAIAYDYFLKWADRTFFLFPVLFGTAIGYTIAWVAKITKMRSYSVVWTIVGIAALVGYYVCWVFWVKLTYDHVYAKDPRYHLELVDLLRNPEFLWQLIQRMNPPGSSRYLIWIGEAVLVFLGAFAASGLALHSEMFCEACKRWCGKPLILRRVIPGDVARLEQSLKAHDFSYLESQQSVVAGLNWEVSYEFCESCKQLHALSVKQFTLEYRGNKIYANRSKVTLVGRILLDPDEAHVLLQRWSNPPVTSPAPQAATTEQIPSDAGFNRTPTGPDDGV